MVAIELQDQTAKAIIDAAETLGVSVDELLRLRVLGLPGQGLPVQGLPEMGQQPSSINANGSQDDIDELMTELKALAFDGPVISDRRVDIYSDD